MCQENSKKNMDLISVIMPIYNAEKYLEKAVWSIRKQTYTEIEIILVNDGSSDRSREICKCMEKEDNRIRLIDKKNEGAAQAKNTGIEVAQGRYLMFVDSDDYIESETLEKMLDELQRTVSDLCICNFIRERKDGTSCEDGAELLQLQGAVKSGYELLGMLNESVWWRLCQPCCKLYKKELFEGIRFPKQVVEDLPVMHRIYDKCTNVCFLNNTFYHYVQLESSISHTRQATISMDLVQILAERILYYNKKKYYELMPGTEALMYDKLQNCCAIVNLKNKEERERFHRLSVLYWEGYSVTSKYKKYSVPEYAKRWFIWNFPRSYQKYLKIKGII